jgi:putative ABC transport system substrate-binding protein
VGVGIAGIVLLTGFIAAAGFGWLASPSRVAHIGFTGSSLSTLAVREGVDGFREGLRDAGWVEGRNLTIEYRWVEDHPERTTSVAEELVALKPDAIVCTTLSAVQAAMHASNSVPIVMVGVVDPVGTGAIASLAHPGGNVTGTSRSVERGQGPKRLTLLREVLPGLSRAAVVFDPGVPAGVNDVREILEAGRRIGVEVQPVPIASVDEMDRVLNASLAGRPEALIYSTAGLLLAFNQRVIVDFASRHHLPSIGWVRSWTEEGGLMSFGPDGTALYRRAAYYVDRILRGAKPGDLPVEQPTAFEFVVSLKAAEALGLSIPPDVAAQVTDWVQ